MDPRLVPFFNLGLRRLSRDGHLGPAQRPKIQTRQETVRVLELQGGDQRDSRGVGGQERQLAVLSVPRQGAPPSRSLFPEGLSDCTHLVRGALILVFGQ